MEAALCQSNLMESSLDVAGLWEIPFHIAGVSRAEAWAYMGGWFRDDFLLRWYLANCIFSAVTCGLKWYMLLFSMCESNKNVDCK
jgi:hypothetical protein